MQFRRKANRIFKGVGAVFAMYARGDIRTAQRFFIREIERDETLLRFGAFFFGGLYVGVAVIKKLCMRLL